MNINGHLTLIAGMAIVSIVLFFLMLFYSKPRKAGKREQTFEEKIKKVSKEEVDLLWELHFHEDVIMLNRASFFLVAQSMLFTAFATLLIGNIRYIIFLIFSIAGIFINIMWIYLTTVQLRYTIKPIKGAIINSEDKRFSKYIEIVKKRRKFYSLSSIQGILIPIFLTIIWIALLAFLK